MPITSNINQFSKFFHCWNQQKICNNIPTVKKFKNRLMFDKVIGIVKFCNIAASCILVHRRRLHFSRILQPGCKHWPAAAGRPAAF